MPVTDGSVDGAGGLELGLEVEVGAFNSDVAMDAVGAVGFLADHVWGTALFDFTIVKGAELDDESGLPVSWSVRWQMMVVAICETSRETAWEPDGATLVVFPDKH